MAHVLLENLTKLFPAHSKPTVNALSLLINDGEFLVLVGPSGSGKTTTLRMIAGLEDVTSGTIRIGDRLVNDLPPMERDIAMVFQNYALYPHLSVFDNMAFALHMQRRKLRLSTDDIKSRVQDAAQKLGIEDLLLRKPRALSGGQRQRVAVGRAIVRNPRAFLFDEPLSNLDAQLRVETRAQLKRLHQQLKTTTLYVTHDQEEAMSLGDRIAVLNHGTLQQFAPPLEVYGHPANRFVAGFIGTPPMNFFDGTLQSDGTATSFHFAGHRIRLTGPLAQAAQAHLGQPMVLGVRPECLSPEAVGPFLATANTLPLRINVVEPLGDKVDLLLSCDDHDHITCRTDAYRFASLAVGTLLNFHINLNRIHLFEPGENGRNITQ